MTQKQHKTIMLVGDSMIEYFDWQHHFKGRTMINLGRSGETVEELLMRAHHIVQQYEAPDMILIMIGTNNVAMENFSFQPTYQEIMQVFSKAYPKSTLVINSLLPMNLNYLAVDTVSRINESLQQLAKTNSALYVDIWTHMVDSSERPLPNVLADEVHLTNNGYMIWAAAFKEFITIQQHSR